MAYRGHPKCDLTTEQVNVLPVGTTLLSTDHVHVMHILARIRQNEVVDAGRHSFQFTHIPGSNEYPHFSVREKTFQLLRTKNRTTAGHTTYQKTPTIKIIFINNIRRS